MKNKTKKKYISTKSRPETCLKETQEVSDTQREKEVQTLKKKLEEQKRLLEELREKQKKEQESSESNPENDQDIGTVINAENDIEEKSFADFEPEDEVQVDAFPLLGKHVIVKTKHKTVVGCIETAREDYEKYGRRYSICMYARIKKAATHADDDEIYERAQEGDSEDWENLCDDVVLLYGMRNSIWNRVIPICMVKDLDKKENSY